jgi:hypothetical protein
MLLEQCKKPFGVLGSVSDVEFAIPVFFYHTFHSILDVFLKSILASILDVIYIIIVVSNWLVPFIIENLLKFSLCMSPVNLKLDVCQLFYFFSDIVFCNDAL